ncbi:MAG: hypothetical protein ABSC03_00295 [Verrucomicrobiota bacterium]|jgi:hypothetical protein
MKLTEHLKAIEQFVLDHKPPHEIRTHLVILQQHLEADDSLLDRIAKNDADHAAVVARLRTEKNTVDAELARLKQAPLRPSISGRRADPLGDQDGV